MPTTPPASSHRRRHPTQGKFQLVLGTVFLLLPGLRVVLVEQWTTQDVVQSIGQVLFGGYWILNGIANLTFTQQKWLRIGSMILALGAGVSFVVSIALYASR